MKTIKINQKNFTLGGSKMMRKFFIILCFAFIGFAGCSMPTNDPTTDYYVPTQEQPKRPEDEDHSGNQPTSENPDNPTTPAAPSEPEAPETPATPVDGGDVEVEAPETDDSDDGEDEVQVVNYTVTINYTFNNTVIGTTTRTVEAGSVIIITHEDLSGSYVDDTTATRNVTVNNKVVTSNVSARTKIFKTTGGVYKYVDYKTNYLDRVYYNEFYFDNCHREFDGWYINNVKVNLITGYAYTVNSNATVTIEGRITSTVTPVLQRQDYYQHTTTREFNPAETVYESASDLNPANNADAYKFYPFFGEILAYAQELKDSDTTAYNNFVELAQQGIIVRTNDWTDDHVAVVTLDNLSGAELDYMYDWSYNDEFQFNATQAQAQPLVKEVVLTQDFSYYPTSGITEEY